MASYTITTSINQEEGLQYSYATYADKLKYPTIEEYFQSRVDDLVTDVMHMDYRRTMAISFDLSFNTIPEDSQAQAKTDIETVITDSGGTIVSANPPRPTPITGPITDILRGALSLTGREIGGNLQVGAADKEFTNPSGPDGYRDNEA